MKKLPSWDQLRRMGPAYFVATCKDRPPVVMSVCAMSVCYPHGPGQWLTVNSPYYTTTSISGIGVGFKSGSVGFYRWDPESETYIGVNDGADSQDLSYFEFHPVPK